MPPRLPPPPLDRSGLSHRVLLCQRHGQLREPACPTPVAAPANGRIAHLWVMCCWLWHVGSAVALDLNTATEAELDGLAGFGPAFTARVMQARAERPFQDWADFIRRVKGVQARTAWRLSQQGARIQQAPFIPPRERVSRD